MEIPSYGFLANLVLELMFKFHLVVTVFQNYIDQIQHCVFCKNTKFPQKI